MTTSLHCTCWVARVALHDGHCCFNYYDAASNTVTCGHDEAGMRALEGHLRPVSAVTK